MPSDIEIRTYEIEQLIASNELNTATKRVMDFVADFAVHRNRKKEAIDLRARYNSLREELRREMSPEVSNEVSRLRRNLLDFIEDVKDENTPILEANLPVPIQSPSSTVSELQATPKLTAINTPSKPVVSQKTQLEQDKEAFLKQRQPVVVPPDLVFHGKDIEKQYRTRSINFSFRLPEFNLRPGEITAVVGENGNGKTTLLRIVAGQLEINKGLITYPMLAAKGNGDLYSIKQQIAYIPQELPHWSGLLIDNLHFSAAIHDIKGEKNVEEVEFIMNRLGLEQYKDATWGQISGGYRMRFTLAKALVWNPALIILDEPLANLDINTQTIFLRDLRYLANSTANPKTMLISSQHLHSVEDVADNIIFIQNGTTHYNGTMQAFGQDRTENSFEFACKLSKEQLADKLEEIPIIRLEEVGYYFLLDTPRDISLEKVLSVLLKHGVVLTYFRDISKSTRKLFELEK